MSVGKLIRLTIQIDLEPEAANLKDTLDYLKALKGAEKVDLVDVAIIADPNVGEKAQRRALEQTFGSPPREPDENPFAQPKTVVTPPALGVAPSNLRPDPEPPGPVTKSATTVPREVRKDLPADLLDRIKIR